MTKANIRHSLMLISLLLTGTTAWAQPTGALTGVWRQDDQISAVTVNVVRCSDNDALCATVIAERLAPGDPSLLNKIVARDMGPSGKQSWKGKYVIDGQSMAASAKLTSKDKMLFKVCLMPFLCDSIQFNRISG